MLKQLKQQVLYFIKKGVIKHFAIYYPTKLLTKILKLLSKYLQTYTLPKYKSDMRVAGLEEFSRK